MRRLLLAMLALLIVMPGETVEHINQTPYFLVGEAARIIAPDALLIGDEIERAAAA